MNRCIAPLMFVVALFFSCTQNPVADKETPVTQIGEAGIDSLFGLLVSRLQALENQEDYNGVSAIDFTSLSSGFSQAIKGNPTHVKANIGFAMAKMLSLNANGDVKKMVDSLQVYFDNISTSEQPVSSPMAKTAAVPAPRLLPAMFARGGIAALGKAMLVKTPVLLMVSPTTIKFPSFVTLGYVQNIISRDVMPALDSCVDAMARLEGLPAPALAITVDGNTKTIDIADIYIVDASLRLSRAMMGMVTAYDADLFTSATDRSYSWIDRMRTLPENSGSYKITLENNTVYKTWTYTDYATEVLSDVVRANLARPDFLTLRSSNHAKAYGDLQAVPDKIKKAIASMRQETGNQDNDLVPLSVLADADGQLVDVPHEMKDNGVSDSLANKFNTPETLVNFIAQLLAGPYRFNETIDSATVDLTINLSAWFTSPVLDLKTMFPKYRVLAPSEQWQASVYLSGCTSWEGGISAVYFSEGDSILIPASAIDHIDSIWSEIYLKTPATALQYRDSSISASPIIFVDEAGADLTQTRIDDLIKNKLFFPVFTDYTFHNIFPSMTRQKWIDLIYQ